MQSDVKFNHVAVYLYLLGAFSLKIVLFQPLCSLSLFEYIVDVNGRHAHGSQWQIYDPDGSQSLAQSLIYDLDGSHN